MTTTPRPGTAAANDTAAADQPTAAADKPAGKATDKAAATAPATAASTGTTAAAAAAADTPATAGTAAATAPATAALRGTTPATAAAAERNTPRPTRLAPGVLAVAVLGLVVVVSVSTLLGAANLGWTRVAHEVWAQLTGGTSPLSETEAAIVWQVRLPRVILAGVVGAALAISGAAFQGVFRNPLADPFLLGAAAGAGMAATIVVVASPAVTDWVIGPLPLAAFAGAIGGVGLTWLLGRSAGGGTAVLLLAGIAVASFLTAVQTFAQQLNTDTIEEVYSWMLGGLNTTGWREVLITLPYLAVAGTTLCLCARLLDVLAVGDDEAASLGINPGRVRLVVLLAASLATASAVAVSGLIGFVGIVVPHMVRLLAGASYRVVVPLSLVGGGMFLIIADYIARTAFAPAELPIGVITAFTGAPFFLLVLRMNRGQVR